MTPVPEEAYDEIARVLIDEAERQDRHQDTSDEQDQTDLDGAA
jgi:hypothetical protein